MTIKTFNLTTVADDGTKLENYVAMPENPESLLAGILIAPEWWGASDSHSKAVADKLANLGFATLVMDVYGEGKLTTDAAQANEWMQQVLKDPKILMGRCTAIYQDFCQLDQLDGEKIGIIGYCFGGKIALDMARIGTNLKAVATFHGNPAPLQPADEKFIAKVLVAHGEADSIATMPAIEALRAELDNAKVDYQIDIYPNAKHAFSNPKADERAEKNGIDVGYDEAAATQSWDKMVAFMKANLG